MLELNSFSYQILKTVEKIVTRITNVKNHQMDTSFYDTNNKSKFMGFINSAGCSRSMDLQQLWLYTCCST